MSLAGLQNYTFPLTLRGPVTINNDFNAKNIYVAGAVIGAGVSKDVLGTDNTWSGTNDFQAEASYTGTVAPTNSTDMLTKEDIDDSVTGFNPTGLSQNWALSSTFSNANPPVLRVAGGTIGSNVLTGYSDMVSITSASSTNLTKGSYTWSGTQTFTNTVGVPVDSGILKPDLDQNPASKSYIDGKVEIAGKAVTYTITTPGTYTFTEFTLTSIIKIDYWLYGGSCGGSSGAMVAGVMGNGGGQFGSFKLVVGGTADPATVYTAQNTSLPSSTVFSIGTTVVGSALGACNLNGTVTAGIAGPTTVGNVYGTSANGKVGNNLFAYSDILGTSTSGGGAVFIAYYL
jgi:hypothetical protein